MIRLLIRLLGIRDFEVCASCETLKLQLEIANSERAELLKTMLNLVKPEVIQHPTTIVKPVLGNSVSWNVRKKALEEKDREEFRIKRNLEIENNKLEKELGLLGDTENENEAKES